jgi:hypothetical protein
MKEFISANGLVMATLLLFLTTLWYALATARMAKVMSRELDLRVRPSLGLGVPVVYRAPSGELHVEHEVVNAGSGYAALRGAMLECWRSQYRNSKAVARPLQLLPVHLAPGQSVKLNFEIPTQQIADVLPSATSVMGGLIKYTYSGLDGIIREEPINLPEEPAKTRQ